MQTRARYCSKMNIFEKYKFSDKVHSPVGIMSVILGGIALLSSLSATVMPYLLKVQSSDRYALVLAIAFFMAIVGIVLGIIGKNKKGDYGIFPKMGLFINTLVILWSLFIIVIGARLI